ncbi:MAG: hypothetical protein RJA22_2141 [Verrucomicrobiota bacterium]
MATPRRSLPRWTACLLLLAGTGLAHGQWVINEALLNPPGPDTTNEFIELRGPPNSVLPPGTWLLGLEGDAAGNPGTIQNRFDLSGQILGQNGFLVLLQKFHRYPVNPLSLALTNADPDGGWGDGNSSDVGHDGENGQVEIENASCTLLLLRSSVAPIIGTDVDANNDGVIDPAHAGAWTILDAVGALDADGTGDIAYGRINFRHDTLPGAGALAGGTVVAVPFTPAYVGRRTNSTGWAVPDWAASDNLTGTAPRWWLGPNTPLSRTTNTVPASLSRAPLNHVGGPNFGARPPPAVLVRETGGGTLVTETGLRDSYTLGLALAPTGAVTLLLAADPPLQISLNGRTFTNELALSLATTAPRRVTVRVLNDHLAGPSPRHPQIRHTLSATRDPARYPLDTRVLPVTVTVLDADRAILTEAKVNPPGTSDAPWEWVELAGPAGRSLTQLWLLAVSGNGGNSAGRIDLAVPLGGSAFGSNGLLIVCATNTPYAFAPGTALRPAPQFSRPGGTLDNGSLSLLLVGSALPLVEGTDLDAGNNGSLEGLPAGAVIMDALGWTGGAPGDVVYGGVDLTQAGFIPDAATRLRGSNTPLSAVSWAAGDLAGTNAAALAFDDTFRTPNVPPGSGLTPGVVNRGAPQVSSGLTPLSHVIGHPENATVLFTVSDPETPAALLAVSAASTNPAVIPDARLQLTHLGGGTWRLALDPVGVGYADVYLRVSNGAFSGHGVLRYAASAPGRPGGRWHTGVADASTAIPVSPDWSLIADDENQNIRLFSRRQSGASVRTIRLSSALDLIDLYGDGSPKEVDIEGSFRVGNRIFWLGSHSHSMDLLERTNRARVFATDLAGEGTGVNLGVVAHYDFLKVDLLAWDAANRHGRGSNYYGLVASASVGRDPKEPDGAGFNLEGLCQSPDGAGAAYLGFRAPLVPPGNRTRALIIPVLNYSTLATRSGPAGSAVFGTPIELPLGRRGIRSIEGSGTNYLIVAGPPGGGTNLPAPANFRLFTWTGRAADTPRERDTDLSGLSPEAIDGLPPLPWTNNTPVNLVSDNGATDFYNDGQQAKHLPIREFKKFRVDTVPLGAPLPPAPAAPAP